MKNESKRLLIIIAVLVGLTGLVYLPGLEGIFVFDDTQNIVNNKALKLPDNSIQSLINASLSSGSGPLHRPISMLSFALNLKVCGLSPFCFKSVNLLIHIFCGFSIFFITLLLIERYQLLRCTAIDRQKAAWVAAGISLIWLLHPINLTSVLYVVQRMNSLSACFVLLGMLLYILGRNRLLQGADGKKWVAGSFLMTLPAMLAKENGALLPLFLLVVEVFFYHFQCATRNDQRLLKSAFILSVLVPALYLAGFLLMQPEWLLERYANREFDLSERLLTQARVFWLYIGLIIIPTNQNLSLYHDYLPISHGLVEPASTLIALLAVVAVVASIWLLRKRAPLISFGFTFFIAGHLMESTVIPLEMVFEHRNYLPSLGLIIPIVYYLADHSISIKTIGIRRIGLVGLIVLFGAVTALRASQWGNPLLLAEMEARTNPDSARVNHSAGAIYATLVDKVPESERETFYAKAQAYFGRVYELDPTHLGGIASQLILASREDKELKKELFQKLIKRLGVKKITATDVDVIKKLLGCVEKKVCNSDVINTREIALALNKNDHMDGKFSAIIFSLLSGHYWNFLAEKEAAFEYSLRAIKSYPNNAQLKINHTKLLIAMGEEEKAREMLKIAIDDDFFNVHKASIDVLKSRLDMK